MIFIPNIKIIGKACRTNIPPNTAFRGFGAPQGIFIMEAVIDKIAEQLKIDPLEIREMNAYKEAEKTPYNQPVHEPCYQEIFKILKEKPNLKSDYEETIIHKMMSNCQK